MLTVVVDDSPVGVTVFLNGVTWYSVEITTQKTSDVLSRPAGSADHFTGYDLFPHFLETR